MCGYLCVDRPWPSQLLSCASVSKGRAALGERPLKGCTLASRIMQSHTSEVVHGVGSGFLHQLEGAVVCWVSVEWPLFDLAVPSPAKRLHHKNSCYSLQCKSRLTVLADPISNHFILVKA